MNPTRQAAPPGTARRFIALAVAIATLAMSLGWMRGHLPATITQPGPIPGLADLPPLATCDEPLTTPVRITSSLAVQCGPRLDGRTVQYAGEVVGDVLQRRRGTWIHLNDDAYALDVGPLPRTGIPAGTNSGLAVWVPADVDAALTPGRHDRRGDVIAVTGTFYRTDPHDGGGTTIHATSATTLTTATTPATSRPPPIAIALAATTLLAAALVAIRTR